MPTRLLLALLAAAVAPAVRAGDPGQRFESTIRPLLAAYCVKCHGADKQKGGLRLDTRADALRGGDAGPAVVPGKPADSLLVKAVRHEDGLDMPPAGKLTDAQIAALEEWVRGGADWPDAAPTAAGAAKKTRSPGTVTAADRAWWAFAPVRRPTVPDAGGGWAVTPVDRFIAQAQAANGVAPAAPAGKAALLRRLTFDLHGLPPTPADTQAFLADPSADAYEKLVDRLLASPAYGERQARLWLDLVRYAETDGYRVDGPRPHAWRYRDYVVRAFNADKPYDRFVTEQLAGDEAFPGDPDALLATGFLRLWPYEYNQKDARTRQAAILTDLTDVTADVFLGLGMGCARCHDHKFDPILQTDYYALQAFFAGLSFPDEPVFPAPAAAAVFAAERAAWEAKTTGLRGRLDALLAPRRDKLLESEKDKFPPDVQAVLRKPAAAQTPTERRLAELAMVQVRFFADRDATAKLPAAQTAEYEALQAELKATDPPAAPVAYVARDIGPVAADTLVPGGRKKAGPVGPAVPTVLGGHTPPVRPSATSTGRRTALAGWLTDPAHPLTARVMVNRVWQQHFGRGLVATPSDYGTLGDKPTHPELLDYLAAEFVADGWSLKKLHRLLVTSAVYRQAAAGTGPAADPDNRWLTRMPVRRLDAEQVRDALLAVSGELDPAAGGPSVPADKPRRSVFTRVARNSPDPLLAAFDAADGTPSCACRNVTVTLTQSLLLLNGAGTLQRATAFAKRVMPAAGADAAAGVDAAFRLAFGRPPTAAELTACREFLRQQVGVASGKAVTPAGRATAWADFCHVLLNSNEFLYVD